MMQHSILDVFFFFRLMDLLEEIGNQEENKTIIFAETKKKVDALTRKIRSVGYVIIESLLIIVF